MKAITFKCNRCGAEITSKGYSASIDEGCSPVGFDLRCGIYPVMEHHYCGKQCLMIEINERIDKMEKAEEATPGTSTYAKGAVSYTPLQRIHPYTERKGAA